MRLHYTTSVLPCILPPDTCLLVMSSVAIVLAARCVRMLQLHLAQSRRHDCAFDGKQSDDWLYAHVILRATCDVLNVNASAVRR
jgi:hypothetical protein